MGARGRAPLPYLEDFPFLAGADFDFLAGDCEDDFVDFLAAAFIGSVSFRGMTTAPIVIFPEIRLKEIFVNPWR